MANWGDSKIVSMETTQVVDTNPQVWINSALESINEKDFQSALKKISSAKEYANGNRNTIGMACALEIVCYYEINDKNKAREVKRKLNDGLEDFLFAYPEYIIRYRSFDSTTWDELWEKLIAKWIRNRDYSRIKKHFADINSKMFAKLADKNFLVDVVQASESTIFFKLKDGGYDLSTCIMGDRNLAMIAATIQTDECYHILKCLLDERVFPINWHSSSGETLLICAINADALKNTKLILEYNPDVNVEYGDTKQTALHIASKKGLSEIVEMLASLGAAVNQKDISGWTALHYAANKSHPEVIKKLLEAKANIHEKNKKGQTALHLAIGSNGCVRILIENGINVKETDNAGEDALVYAVRKRESIPIKLLHNAGADLNKRYKSLEHNRTVLHYIAANNHWSNDAKSTWRELIKCGANINLLDDAGYTPLMLSVDHNWTFSDELTFARELVNKGANTSIRANDGKTVESIMRSHNIDPSKLHNTESSNWFTKLFD